MGKQSGRALLAAAAVSACLAAPGSAPAAVTFGADLADPMLAPDGSPISCAAFTVTQSDGVAEPGSPISGVLVSARVRTQGLAASGFLRVLHPTGVGNGFRNEGQAPVAVTGGADHVTEVLTRLRIAAGDRIAAAFPGFATYLHNDPDAVMWSRGEPPAHAVGAVEFYTPGGCGPGNFEVLVQGTVELDADNDGFGDETQDQCVGTPGPFNGCPNTLTLDKLRQRGTKPKVKVTATVPGAGTLTAGSASDPALASAAAKKSLKPVTRTLTSTTQQQVVLTLKLTKSAKRKFTDTGKLKGRVKVLYTPPGGPSGSQSDKVKLKS